MRPAAPGRHRRWPTRTKILATLGPATRSVTRIRRMIQAGADVFRINCAHGTPESREALVRAVRRAARLEGRIVGILADLQGPKIRVGALEEDAPIALRRGELLRIVARPAFIGRPGVVGCSYKGLARDVRPGQRLLIDDGTIELRAESVHGDEVRARVRHGGLLRPRKGINLPGTLVGAPSLGPKDRADLAHILRLGVDYVALSFVRSAADVVDLKRRIRRAGGEAEVIAKVERPEAVRAIDAIVEAADGILVARGDMGVELGAEAVPGVQKRIVALCLEQAKPAIVATQMLESMIQSPRPTRAEASDVANAVHDGAAAIMLSGETAMGAYPVVAVRTMERIARRTEALLYPGSQFVAAARGEHRRRRPETIAEAAVRAAASAARAAGASVVAVFTETGLTAGLVGRERLMARVVAFSSSEAVCRRLALHWGVVPVLLPRVRSVADLLARAEAELVRGGHARPGERVVFLAGRTPVAGAAHAVVIREIRPASRG